MEAFWRIQSDSFVGGYVKAMSRRVCVFLFLREAILFIGLHVECIHFHKLSWKNIDFHYPSLIRNRSGGSFKGNLGNSSKCKFWLVLQNFGFLSLIFGPLGLMACIKWWGRSVAFSRFIINQQIFHF